MSALHGPLNLQGLRLRSLLLDGVPVKAVGMPSMCKLHALRLEEYSVLHVSARLEGLASLATSLSTPYPGMALVRALRRHVSLTYLEVHLSEAGTLASWVSLGNALQHFETVWHDYFHHSWRGSPAAGAVARSSQDARSGVPSTGSTCWQPAVCTYRGGTMQCVSLLLALNGMTIAGKHWSASQSRSGLVRQQVIGRYPHASWRHMQQIFCHCSRCMHKDVDSKIAECSRPCGATCMSEDT